MRLPMARFRKAFIGFMGIRSLFTVENLYPLILAKISVTIDHLIYTQRIPSPSIYFSTR